MPNSFPFYDAEPYWPAGGYGNGGGGGGGGSSTALLTDFWLWNITEGSLTEIPSSVSYVSGFSNGLPIYTDLRFDAVTRVTDGTTVYGIHVHDCPVGAILKIDCDNITACVCSLCYLPNGESDPVNHGMEFRDNVCLMPIEGYVISGIYYSGIA